MAVTDLFLLASILFVLLIAALWTLQPPGRA
jgi:hypothetical protein